MQPRRGFRFEAGPGGNDLMDEKTLLDQPDQTEIEHFRVNPEVFKAGVRHCAYTSRGKGGCGKLNHVTVPHYAHYWFLER
jgi:hypothetical protein